jgi:hypothetical protein
MPILNYGLMKHPNNWLTVGLMLFLAAMAGTLVLHGIGHEPSTGADES